MAPAGPRYREDEEMCNGQWTDKQKFWYDSIRSFGFLALTVFISLVVIGHFERKRGQDEFRWRSSFSDKVAIRNEFIETEYKYSATAYDVLDNLNKTPDYELQKKWQNDYYDDFRVARYKIELIGSYSPELARVDRASEVLYSYVKIYTDNNCSIPVDTETWEKARSEFKAACRDLTEKLNVDIYSSARD